MVEWAHAMKPTHLFTLCTALACSIAAAHPYRLWENPTTHALQAEAQLMQSPDSPEKNLRIAVGDKPENSRYWSGEKPLPAAQTADLLQLSLAAGSTGAEDWFTNAAGDVLAFVARPGVGAKHYVFTVFTRREEGWQKTGTYHFISRHLSICWQKVTLAHSGLRIVATSPGGSLRMEKRFDLADAHDTFCAYDAPHEAADMGLDPPASSPQAPAAEESAPHFLHYSTSGYPRYDNSLTHTLEAEIALINGRISPEQGRRAFAGVNPDNAAYWNGEKALPAARVADLLQLSLHAGHTTEACWFTNASGSLLVFVAQPGNGAVSDVYTVFRRTGAEYRRVGVYSFTRRGLNLCADEMELTEQGLTLTYATRHNNTRVTKTFSFHTPEDSCCAFEDSSESNDYGRDTRPNRYIGLPELAESPARERLQPCNEITRRLLRAERAVCYAPDPLPSVEKESWRYTDGLTLLYQGKLRHGGVEDWISNAKGDTIAFITRSGVKHEVITTYTFEIYRVTPESYKYIGTYKLNFSPYELRWDPEETYFLPHGLHVRCADLAGTRHTGVIFHFNSKRENVQLN